MVEPEDMVLELEGMVVIRFFCQSLWVKDWLGFG